MNDLYAIDIFSGAGGLSVGLKQAGFNVVLANEIDKNFAKTYSKNHPNTKMLNKNIYDINFKKELQCLNISKIALLAGGPPCQGFSTVGFKNKQDVRNSLFYEFLRAIKEIDPQYILFENVAGFKNMYNGKAYSTLLFELSKLGFCTSANILDTSDFGLPQKRLRTIILGWKKSLNSIKLPVPTHQNNTLFSYSKKLTLMDAISDLPKIVKYKKSSIYLNNPKNYYQRTLRKNTTILTEHNTANYGIKMQEILSLIPQGGCVNDLPQRLKPKKYFSNTYARLLPEDPSPTITRNFGTPSSSRCVHPFENRALSTREGARLQGFADDYKFYGSKTSKNLQIGNAVPPIFARVIAKQIIDSLN